MNTMKRVLAVGASAALLVSMIAGCGAGGQGEGDASTKKKLDNVYEEVLGVPADTVMATCNGRDITAQELGYWLGYDLAYLNSNGVALDTAYSDTQTYGEFALEDALNIAAGYSILAAKAEELGVTLSDEEKTQVDENINTYITQFGTDKWDEAVESGDVVEADYSEEDKAAWIQEQGELEFSKQLACYCSTLDFFRQLNELSLLSNSVSANFSDDELNQYAEDNSYYCSKSVLFQNLTDEEGNTVAYTDMTDEQKAELKAEAQTVLDEVLASDDPEATLLTYVNGEDNDDPGIASYEKGYIFPAGTMVSEYEAALDTMQIGEIKAELVETADYGYFILMRCPIDFDATTLTGYSLRTTYFSDQMSAWQSSAEVEKTDAFNALDITTISDNLNALTDELYPEEAAEETTPAESTPAESTPAESTPAESTPAETTTPQS